MSFYRLGHPLPLLLFILVFLSTSCTNLSIFAPSLSELTTTTGFSGGYHPADRANTFYIDSPQICCSAKLSGAHPDTRVQVNWIYIRGGMAKEEKPLIRSEESTCDSDCYVGFTLPAPPEGFIAGEYRVELTANDGNPTSTSFLIQRDSSGPLPVINVFNASALAITAGQSTVLKWKTSNATLIHIQPTPGTVSLEGMQNVSPSTDTTYILRALNRRGASSSAISVKVSPLAIHKADLIVTNFWNTGNILFYNVKNSGNLASCPTETCLYKNDMLAATDYVQPLDPGQERVESFDTYHFSPRFPSATGSAATEGTTDAVTMRICANVPRACAESNDSNNCIEQNFGPLLTIHLQHFANTAQWQCNTGALVWPMLPSKSGGYAKKGTAQVDESGNYPDSLLMSPPRSTNGWIEAQLGIIENQSGKLQPFYIPHKCKITSGIGLSSEVPDASSVKFIIGTMQGSEVNYFPPVIMDAQSKLATYEIDLRELAGKQVFLIFRVESSEPLQQGSAVWIDPTLVQER